MAEQQTGKAPTPTFPDKGESAPQQQETLAPQAERGRKYRTLTPGEFILRCSYILPNACQCWKAGEEQVTDKDADGKERTYQLCERHAKITRAIDIGVMKPENVNTVLKEQTVYVPNVPMTTEEVKEALPQGGSKKNEAQGHADRQG